MRVKVPASTTTEPEVTEQTSIDGRDDTRDVVGTLVGVSGSYIDITIKVLKSDIEGLR